MFDQLDVLDEKHVEIVADAIADNRISCAVQDIYSTSAPEEILYGECLARLTGTDGRIYGAGAFVPCLEALREAPLLDRHMVKLVLDLLQYEPTKVLGCNLSPDNLANVAAWNGILDQIANRAHLAQRLVLEVTEVQEMGSLSSCAELIAEVQRLGCRVALDDFGAGFASPRLLQLINFDIVKIDQAFVHDIRPSFKGRDSLQNIVGFASSFAPMIVIEGVETAAQIDAARTAGATHVQGYFFSVPAPYITSTKAKLEAFIP
ncbi:EAL domain-containing protein [Ochrobactrum quorumnocens]|uniref:EAL domain-containing protein n=1 Tax=Ochrobactrum quorumnocens TaxID=271865 RepID=UPI003853B75E